RPAPGSRSPTRTTDASSSPTTSRPPPGGHRMTTTDRLDEIKARANAATPGPWGWFGNTDVKDLYLATKQWGRHYVMGFRRWGMQSAQPEFAHNRHEVTGADGL